MLNAFYIPSYIFWLALKVCLGFTFALFLLIVLFVWIYDRIVTRIVTRILGK